MNILIAGGNGEVGRDLSYYFSKNNKIIVGSRSQNNSRKGNILFKKIDFSKKITINQDIDLIINCIATHNYSKKKDFEDYYKSNVLSVMNLIKFAEKRKIKIINLSTISVYDFNSNHKITEDDFEIANNMLAVTKYIGEKLFQYSAVDIINLRMPGVLTTNRHMERPWLNLIVNKIRNKKKLKIFNLDTKFNSVIDTKEIYKFIKFVLKNKFISGNYNFMANNPLKLIQILKILKKINKSNSQIISSGRKNIQMISNLKIRKIFKFKISPVKKIILRNLND